MNYELCIMLFRNIVDLSIYIQDVRLSGAHKVTLML